MPLGGQAEVGKSMYSIEVNGKIFIIDAGYRFPDLDKLGVDIIIPSFDYLIERKKDIVAIIITHGHNDVMAALPYLLNAIQGVPVYAPNLTADLIEMMIDHLTQNGVLDAAQLYEPPFNQIHYEGVDGVFADADVDNIFGVVEAFNEAVA